MLDLTKLELIVPDLLVLEPIPLKPILLEPIPLEPLRALPETISIGCKTAGVVCLNSTPVSRTLGRNSAQSVGCQEARKYRDRGDLIAAIVKFGKGKLAMADF
jgi:hypothetical protein